MNAPQVTLYTLSGCGPCAHARRLLRRRGIAFREVCGDDDPRFDRLLLERTGALSVPQIVIDGVPIGGADNLARLDRLGVLEELLAGERLPLARVVRRLSLRGLLLAWASGGRRSPYAYWVELIGERGRLLERRRACSAEDADLLAEAMGSWRERVPDAAGNGRVRLGDR